MELKTIPMNKEIDQYITLLENLRDEDEGKQKTILRHLCRTDLFFLLWYGFSRKDILHPWLFDRCREVQKSPNGHIDLWARGHYKSTIITFAKTIQDILSSHGDNPFPEWKGREVTCAIFSATRPLAKGFLRQIKLELERNEKLKDLFPDILWQNPAKEAPKWSEDDGLIMKRISNPKEATIEAWGIIDGQPTGKHFLLCVYDDLVSIQHVRSPGMMLKTLESWELSLNLSTEGGIHRYIGTRYHFNDAYKSIIERNVTIPRVYSATDDGTSNGNSIFLKQEDLDEKRNSMGLYTFSSQMLLNPIADSNKVFKQDWLMFRDKNDHEGMNLYIVVDPANSKKKNSDYTIMLVIGLGPDNHYYLIDAVRDRLNLEERSNMLFALHRQYRPLDVGYESYGIQADLQHFQEKMAHENYYFSITPLGGKVKKEERIEWLQAVFMNKRFIFPSSIMKANYEGVVKNIIQDFLMEEYYAFPLAKYDDMLDAMARILDADFNVVWPRQYEEHPNKDRYQKSMRTLSSPWGV
jgi:predicted phage terminase large subunit-like protein